MKHLLLLFAFCFAVQTWAVDYGTYVWVGVGCRDSSLSEESHVTKSMSSNPVGVSSAVLNINSDGTASMRSIIQGEERNNSARYEERNNKIVFLSEEGEEVFSLHVVGDTLVGIEDDESASNEICGSDKVYVYVLGKVD